MPHLNYIYLLKYIKQKIIFEIMQVSTCWFVKQFVRISILKIKNIIKYYTYLFLFPFVEDSYICDYRHTYVRSVKERHGSRKTTMFP